MPVRNPIIRAMPTRSSPYATACDHRTTLGDTACVRNHAYHHWTSGCAPPVLVSAPCTKPLSAAPELSPTHAGFCTFSHPAESHSKPRYMRTINQNHALLVSERKKWEN